MFLSLLLELENYVIVPGVKLGGADSFLPHREQAVVQQSSFKNYWSLEAFDNSLFERNTYSSNAEGYGQHNKSAICGWHGTWYDKIKTDNWPLVNYQSRQSWIALDLIMRTSLVFESHWQQSELVGALLQKGGKTLFWCRAQIVSIRVVHKLWWIRSGCASAREPICSTTLTNMHTHM